MRTRWSVGVLQGTLFEEFAEPKQVFRYLRNYLAGRFVGATRDEVLLDELLKCLFCKLLLESRGRDVTQGPTDAAGAARSYRAIFREVRHQFPSIYNNGDEILLDPESLCVTMRSLNFRILNAQSDPIGDAFEVFAGAESRGRSGQFFTPRNAADLLVEMVDPKPGERVIDPACGAGGFLASVARHLRKQGISPGKLISCVKSWAGVEKDAYLSRLALVHATLLAGGEPDIVCGDSLAMIDQEGNSLDKRIPVGGYDVVVTNPPFGAKIVAASPGVIGTFELGRKWIVDKDSGSWAPTNEARKQVPPQVLFVERCLSLLKDAGRLGVVMPESVLSNKAYRHVVAFMRDRGRIKAVVGMPESLFKTSGKGGTHTKTCLVVMEKGSRAKYPIFMAEATWCGKDSRARSISKDDLPQIASQYSDFAAGKLKADSRVGYVVRPSMVKENVLCPRYYDPDVDGALDKLSSTHNLMLFGDMVSKGILAIRTGDEVGKLAYGSGPVPFVRTSDMSNWEIKIDPKHCVEREIYLALREKQDVRENDILMVKDGTYLIGTCAIVTKYDRELIYQSHIYKIRLLKADLGLNPFLLLAILGNSLVQRQIKAKQFTQDIIDSLGDRVMELVLPIPKSKSKRDAITNKVKKVISDRIEARELVREAVADVTS